MPLHDSDILMGKLAIGRQYVSRQDALTIAQEVDSSLAQGRSESFSAAALRLGFLQRNRVDELLGVLKQGALVCRGSCGEEYRLAQMRSEETVACRRCGGPLYVKRGAPAAAPDPFAVDESGEGGRTLMDLEGPEMPPPAPDGGEQEGSTTFLDLDPPEMPDAVANAPTVVASAPSPAPDLPSAILHPDARKLESLGSEDAGATFIDLDDDFDEHVESDEPDSSPPPPGDEAGEGTLEFDQDTLQGFGGKAFEPFDVGALRVVAPIGKGGMGTVYRAHDAASGQVRAIKILSNQAELNEEVLTRFKREVLLSSRLDHPNIVRVYEAGLVPDGEDAGRPFYAMDYVQGKDLTGWHAERERSISECVAIVSELCGAMNYAHSHGVVHRDLKPGNVLVNAAGHPLICDFGLAKYRADMQNLTRTGDILGTPSYMPPEQALGNRKKIGPPTDVYAIGAILYYLLTGRPPFRGPSAFATINKVVREAPVPPSQHNPQVSADVEAVVLKALQKEPVDRFHTCSEMGAALGGL